LSLNFWGGRGKNRERSVGQAASASSGIRKTEGIPLGGEGESSKKCWPLASPVPKRSKGKRGDTLQSSD